MLNFNAPSPDDIRAIGRVFCEKQAAAHGVSFAGYAAYALDSRHPGEAWVMDWRNAPDTTQTHERFSRNVLDGRKIAVESTSLPAAIQNPGRVMPCQSALVPGHICFNLKPDENAPLILQAVFHGWKGALPNNNVIGCDLYADEFVAPLLSATAHYPASKAARRVQEPAIPNAFLVYTDIAGSRPIRKEAGMQTTEIFETLAQGTSDLADKFGGVMFRGEGDGGCTKFSIPPADIRTSVESVRNEQIVPFARGMTELFDTIRRDNPDILTLQNARLKIVAKPGYVRSMSGDFDGAVMEDVREKMDAIKPGGKLVQIYGMPDLFR